MTPRIKKMLLLAASLCALFPPPPPAKADTIAALSNVLLVEQSVDVVQTQQFLRAHNCLTIVAPDTFPEAKPSVIASGCAPAFVEADPFARLFVHSAALQSTVSGGINLALRSYFSEHPKQAWELAVIDSVYVSVLFHNVSSFGFSKTIRLGAK